MIHKLGNAWDPSALGGDRKFGNGDRLCDISGGGVVFKSSAQSGEGTGFLVPLVVVACSVVIPKARFDSRKTEQLTRNVWRAITACGNCI